MDFKVQLQINIPEIALQYLYFKAVCNLSSTLVSMFQTHVVLILFVPLSSSIITLSDDSQAS